MNRVACGGFRLVALCLLALPVAGDEPTVNQVAERRIQEALPAYIGPAKTWKVTLENPALDTLRGRFSRLRLNGEEVQLRQSLACETLNIEVRDAVVDYQKQQLQSVGQTTFAAAVNETSLNDFLKRNPLSEEEPVRIRRVQMKKGLLHVEATRWLFRRAWAFTLTVAPRIVNKTRLEFDPEQMTVLGVRVPLPKSALRWIASRLNQGFDFSTLPFPLEITCLQVEDGRASVEGSADVMKSLNERLAANPPASR